MAKGSASDPSVRQLRLLLVLSEELHFGRAAQRLFISQPALSRQIQALEERLGLTLVERSTRRVELTPAGEAVLPHARAMVDAADGLREAVESARRTRTLSGRTVLGAYAVALPVIGAIVQRMRALHPDLQVELREVTFAEQAQVLLEGRVDAVLCFGPVPAGLQSLEVATQPRLVCLPDGHPLARRDRVTIAELAGIPLINVPDHVPRVYRDFWSVDPRPDGSPVLATDHRATTLDTMMSAVCLGQGITFAAADVRELMPRPGISYVDVVDLSPCSVILAWAAARREVPAIVALRGVVREVCGATAAAGPNARWWDTPAPLPPPQSGQLP
ncbi:LysR family transcriptional regulator [Streptomyces griseocarneus]|uniref:LysR family transcriptional regulator n=1 Tax=Streptomyces griseocarneus TaxID=51201 RepID=UPI00167D76BF|nr:LysR family transcriptional regulator [Streptomyces griseocarneus]MBZ6476791.1 LysR family transcriptional regulator [Streptomyces griseocarneus]GHG81424.1 LysR family transcriptional regulator [Streptomyces griseocarneus]